MDGSKNPPAAVAAGILKTKGGQADGNKFKTSHGFRRNRQRDVSKGQNPVERAAGAIRDVNQGGIPGADSSDRESNAVTFRMGKEVKDMSETELILKIERLRRELNALVLEMGTMAQAVLKKSMELDEVLNQYNRLTKGEE